MPKPVSASYRPAFSVAMELVSKAAEMREVDAMRVARANDRFHDISHPRFGVVWVLRMLDRERWTLNRIAKTLGFKEHTAVRYAFRRAEELRASDETFRAFTDNLYVWALMQGMTGPQVRVAA